MPEWNTLPYAGHLPSLAAKQEAITAFLKRKGHMVQSVYPFHPVNAHTYSKQGHIQSLWTVEGSLSV